MKFNFNNISEDRIECYGDVLAEIRITSLTKDDIFNQHNDALSFTGISSNLGVPEFRQASFSSIDNIQHLPSMILMEALKAALLQSPYYIESSDSYSDVDSDLPGVKVFKSNSHKCAVLHSGILNSYETIEHVRTRLCVFYNWNYGKLMTVNDLL